MCVLLKASLLTSDLSLKPAFGEGRAEQEEGLEILNVLVL